MKSFIIFLLTVSALNVFASENTDNKSIACNVMLAAAADALTSWQPVYYIEPDSQKIEAYRVNTVDKAGNIGLIEDGGPGRVNTTAEHVAIRADYENLKVGDRVYYRNGAKVVVMARYKGHFLDGTKLIVESDLLNKTLIAIPSEDVVGLSGLHEKKSQIMPGEKARFHDPIIVNRALFYEMPYEHIDLEKSPNGEIKLTAGAFEFSNFTGWHTISETTNSDGTVVIDVKSSRTNEILFTLTLHKYMGEYGQSEMAADLTTPNDNGGEDFVVARYSTEN